MLGRTTILIVLLWLPACGRWSDASLDNQTAERIDHRVEIGMTLDDFEALFPDSEFWRERDGQRQYVVSVSEPCFRCYSAEGFARSRDYFVRIVQFENGELVSIDPVSLQR